MSEKLGSPEAIIRAEKRVLSHPQTIADSDRLNLAKTLEHALLSGILGDCEDMRARGTLNESCKEALPRSGGCLAGQQVVPSSISQYKVRAGYWAEITSPLCPSPKRVPPAVCWPMRTP